MSITKSAFCSSSTVESFTASTVCRCLSPHSTGTSHTAAPGSWIMRYVGALLSSFEPRRDRGGGGATPVSDNLLRLGKDALPPAASPGMKRLEMGPWRWRPRPTSASDERRGGFGLA